MSEQLVLQAEADAIVVSAGDVDIARYVFEPDAPEEEARSRSFIR
jgi:hypothetical protein